MRHYITLMNSHTFQFQIQMMYKPISQNVYVHTPNPKQRRIYEATSHCLCHRSRQLQLYCTSSCVNRSIKVQCDDSNCLCQNYCTNRMFTRGNITTFEVFDTYTRGKGLKTRSPLSKGEFVVEYMGEVYGTLCKYGQKRFESNRRKQLLYMMNLGDGLTVDARKKGNLARFINHSCDPNCGVEKWMVEGQPRIGIFALRNLEVGEQLTYNYGDDFWREATFDCSCGSPKCRSRSAPSRPSLRLQVKVQIGHLLYFQAKRMFYIEQPCRCEAIWDKSWAKINENNASLKIFVTIHGEDEDVYRMRNSLVRLKSIHYFRTEVEEHNMDFVKEYLEECEMVFVLGREGGYKRQQLLVIGLKTELRQISEYLSSTLCPLKYSPLKEIVSEEAQTTLASWEDQERGAWRGQSQHQKLSEQPSQQMVCQMGL